MKPNEARKSVGKTIKHDLVFSDAGEKETLINFKFEILYSCRKISVAAQRLL
jgi:hypothetical protein